MSVRRFHDVYEKEDLEKIQEVIKEGGWRLHHRFENFPKKENIAKIILNEDGGSGILENLRRNGLRV